MTDDVAVHSSARTFPHSHARNTKRTQRYGTDPITPNRLEITLSFDYFFFFLHIINSLYRRVANLVHSILIVLAHL